ncbi:hypothetical protein [Azospirillum sp.]|uniref:hypothetical protein n=1 Tax=Azospirillum sp. TaxID=34012 RepID=UPI002D3CD645|nr:hypothetical protein [Azospirillum sp.]HYD69701.1 hypothetical protein [Azospirillum sp.]
MNELLNDPFVQSSALPLALGFALVGVLRVAGGAAVGRRIAVAGIAAAFLAVFALVIGVPALPPPSSMGKLFWSAAVGLALGLATDTVGLRGRAASALVAVWLSGSLAWIAAPAIASAADVATALILLAVGAWVAFGRLPSRAEGPAAPAAVLLALALAVGGTALIGSSASIAQAALALAAATGGFLLWNWPVERHAWGVSGQAALGIVVLLAAVLAFFTQAQAALLLIALPAVLADHLRRRLPLPETGFGRAAGTAAMTVIAILPALAAIGAAYLLTGGEASPY